MIWGNGSAWFFLLLPNPTSKPAQTRLKTSFSQKSVFYGTSTLNSPYGMLQDRLLETVRNRKLQQVVVIMGPRAPSAWSRSAPWYPGVPWGTQGYPREPPTGGGGFFEKQKRWREAEDGSRNSIFRAKTHFSVFLMHVCQKNGFFVFLV